MRHNYEALNEIVFGEFQDLECTELQGVSGHWTPGNLAKCQALYKQELDTWKFSKCLIS